MPPDLARQGRAAKWGVFALWLIVVVVLAAHHVPWRDEVRALSFARAGDGPVAMVRMAGDGHPALWFLMLRAAYGLTGTPLVLPVLALLVAAAAMALIVTRAPYRWWQIALFAATQFMVFDFAVIARNYGISVLLMAALAALPERWRRTGVLPGILLALLANTNVHSTVFAAGYLLFEGFGLLRAPAPERQAAMRGWLVSATLASIGIALCVVSIYPPLNTAAREDIPVPSIAAFVTGMIVPALPFDRLAIAPIGEALGIALPFTGLAYQLLAVAMSGVLLAAAFALVRSRGAIVAALFALYVLSAFFMLVYPGDYRHDALWLVFVLSLDWTLRARAAPATPRSVGRLAGAALLFLLAIQVPVGVMTAAAALDPARPYSRAADLAHLIGSDPALAPAIVMSEPDYLVETMPYFVGNPLYLPRERRFGRTAQFDERARRDYSLDAMLSDASALHASTDRPVLLLIHHPTGPGAERIATAPSRRTFAVTAASLARLHRCTHQLARYSPAVTDESFGVFLLPRRTGPDPRC